MYIFSARRSPRYSNLTSSLGGVSLPGVLSGVEDSDSSEGSGDGDDRSKGVSSQSTAPAGVDGDAILDAEAWRIPPRVQAWRICCPACSKVRPYFRCMTVFIFLIILVVCTFYDCPTP